MKLLWIGAAATAVLVAACTSPQDKSRDSFWALYESTFKTAKYVDLTHAFEPVQPVWPGFGPAQFKPAVAGSDLGDYAKKGDEFTYEKHGFIATAYELTTDQYGTQLDPPAHWDNLGATISDLPASFTLRPLVMNSSKSGRNLAMAFLTGQAAPSERPQMVVPGMIPIEPATSCSRSRSRNDP